MLYHNNSFSSLTVDAMQHLFLHQELTKLFQAWNNLPSKQDKTILKEAREYVYLHIFSEHPTFVTKCQIQVFERMGALPGNRL